MMILRQTYAYVDPTSKPTGVILITNSTSTAVQSSQVTAAPANNSLKSSSVVSHALSKTGKSSDRESRWSEMIGDESRPSVLAYLVTGSFVFIGVLVSVMFLRAASKADHIPSMNGYAQVDKYDDEHVDHDEVGAHEVRLEMERFGIIDEEEELEELTDDEQHHTKG